MFEKLPPLGSSGLTPTNQQLDSAMNWQVLRVVLESVAGTVFVVCTHGWGSAHIAHTPITVTLLVCFGSSIEDCFVQAKLIFHWSFSSSESSSTPPAHRLPHHHRHTTWVTGTETGAPPGAPITAPCTFFLPDISCCGVGFLIILFLLPGQCLSVAWATCSGKSAQFTILWTSISQLCSVTGFHSTILCQNAAQRKILAKYSTWSWLYCNFIFEALCPHKQSENSHGVTGKGCCVLLCFTFGNTKLSQISPLHHSFPDSLVTATSLYFVHIHLFLSSGNNWSIIFPRLNIISDTHFKYCTSSFIRQANFLLDLIVILKTHYLISTNQHSKWNKFFGSKLELENQAETRGDKFNC